MDLDKLQVNASIRSGWQAVDLGFLMARAWWRPLYAATLVPILPIAMLLLVVFAERPFWALFILWWLLPFWERLPLFIASRLQFDESPGIWASMRAFPLKDVLPWLLWRRFSIQRAFDNPVTVLEELKGKQRRARLRVLHGKYSDVALGNQFVCFCFELIACLGLMILFDFFTPDALDLKIYDSFDEVTLAGEWIYTLAALAAMILVLPFHTMGGFALYLNRRIELEAWDIEISFRNLAQRRRQAAAAAMLATVLLGGAIGLGLPGDADAAVEHNHDSARQLIEEVLSGPDFGEERVVRKWRFKVWSVEEVESLPEWLIDFVEWWE